MEERKPQVCRLCLSLLTNYENMTDVEQDMVQIVIPELNVGICTDVFICEYCNFILQETFSFKSSCLEIEATIHNYTNNGEIQVNLDKIIGLKELEIHDQIEKNTKICRTCLNSTDPLSYITLNSDTPLEWEMLQYSLPEMDLKLTKDPIMCKNCLQLLEKLFNFHQRCIKSENRIWTYLQDKSEDFKKDFKLVDLFQDHKEKENQSENDNDVQLHIHGGENNNKQNKEDSNILEKSSISSQSVLESSGAKEKSEKKSPNDSLLEQLDTAILSCEDTLSQSNAQENNKRKSLPVDLNDFIEEVSYSSDEINQNAKKPYNTRNKRKKIVVDTDDNVSQDPDFKVDNMDDDSDDDYVEGSEEFGWIPKTRKSSRESHSKRISGQKSACTFCGKQIYVSVMAQHLVMCARNPQNNILVECAHCGDRMYSMHRLQHHMLNCQKYIKWKPKNTFLGRNQSSIKDNQLPQPVTVVYNCGQDVMRVPNPSIRTSCNNKTNSEVCATLGKPHNLNDTIEKNTNRINVQQNLLLTQPRPNIEPKIINHNVLKEPEKYWSLPSVQTYQSVPKNSVQTPVPRTINLKAKIIATSSIHSVQTTVPGTINSNTEIIATAGSGMINSNTVIAHVINSNTVVIPTSDSGAINSVIVPVTSGSGAIKSNTDILPVTSGPETINLNKELLPASSASGTTNLNTAMVPVTLDSKTLIINKALVPVISGSSTVNLNTAIALETPVSGSINSNSVSKPIEQQTEKRTEPIMSEIMTLLVNDECKGFPAPSLEDDTTKTGTDNAEHVPEKKRTEPIMSEIMKLLVNDECKGFPAPSLEDDITKTGTNNAEHVPEVNSSQESIADKVAEVNTYVITDETDTVTSTSEIVQDVSQVPLVKEVFKNKSTSDVDIIDITSTDSTESNDGLVRASCSSQDNIDRRMSQGKNELYKFPAQSANADSSNSLGTRTETVLADVTTTDYLKSELTKISASYITELCTQFLGVFKCDRCQYNTRHLNGIENHVLTHFSLPKNNENYFCVICHKLINGLYNFLTHMKQIHGHFFYKNFYWCVRCAEILQDIKRVQFHECQKKDVTVKMFKSNGIIFCMLCKFESESISESKQHIKLCALKSTKLQPTEIIEIDDD